MMKQSFGIAFVAAAMALQLLFLPTRSMFNHAWGPDRPKMTLPVASHGSRHCGRIQGEISWTKTGGWAVSGSGSIRAEDLETYLSAAARRCEERGIGLRLRIRIPPDAPAREFLHLCGCMERAGAMGFQIAVVRPGAPWI